VYPGSTDMTSNQGDVEKGFFEVDISEMLFENKNIEIEKYKNEYISKVSENSNEVTKNDLSYDLLFDDINIDEIITDGLFYLPGRILNRPEAVKVSKESDMNKITSPIFISIHPKDAIANNINEVFIFIIRKVLQVYRMGVEYLKKSKKNKKKEFFSKRIICFI